VDDDLGVSRLATSCLEGSNLPYDFHGLGVSPGAGGLEAY